MAKRRLKATHGPHRAFGFSPSLTNKIHRFDSCTYLRPELLGWGRAPWSSMTKFIGLTKSLGLVKHKQRAQFIFNKSLSTNCCKGWSHLLLSSDASGKHWIMGESHMRSSVFSHMNRFFPSSFLFFVFTGNRLYDQKSQLVLPWMKLVFGAVVNFHQPSIRWN